MIDVGRKLRRPALPASDTRELRDEVRRTSVVRLGLAALLVALLAVAVLLAVNLKQPQSSYFAAGAGGIVVIDLSSSVDPNRYRRIARVLRSVSETGQRTGLVAFSDTAYEVLPPGTRGDEFAAMIRFFDIKAPVLPPGTFQPEQSIPRLPPSPWTGSFRGGTRISTGLKVAREVIARDGISNPGVLLISDLDDSQFDVRALTNEVGRYEREGIVLRVVPLFPAEEDRKLFYRLVGTQNVVQNQELLSNAKLRERRTVVGTFPYPLVAVGVLLLLGLALNEHLTSRVSWKRAVA